MGVFYIPGTKPTATFFFKEPTATFIPHLLPFLLDVSGLGGENPEIGRNRYVNLQGRNNQKMSEFIECNV